MKTEFEPRILLLRGRGFVSSVLRAQTGSVYGHAALMLPDGSVIEAWPGVGVRRTWLRDWTGVDVFAVRDMTDKQWSAANQFARKQIGKPYDWLGVVRVVSRFRPQDNGRWSSAALVVTALEVAGVRLLRHVRACEVSPGMLAKSPLLLHAN